MDSTENQHFRSSTLGRSQLPQPRSHTQGLAELSESQNNARPQSLLMKPTNFGHGQKRETPQPAFEPDPKRKPLWQKAGEYPTKETAASRRSPRRPAPVKGKSLVQATQSSQVKMPSSGYSTRSGSASTTAPSISRHTSNSSFASSQGPGRHAPFERPKTAASNRPGLTRTRAGNGPTTRSHTSHGHRGEEELEDEIASASKTTAVDVDGKLDMADSTLQQMKQFLDSSTSERKVFEDAVLDYRKRIADLEEERNRVNARNETLESDLAQAKDEARSAQFEIEAQKRNLRYELEDQARNHRLELDELRKELTEETELTQKNHREALEALDRHYRVELEEERSTRAREMQEVRSKLGNEQQDLHLTLQRKDREVAEMRSQMEAVKGDLDREQALKKSLEANISEMAAANVTLEAKISSLKSHVEFLESDNQAQSDSFASMEARLQEALRTADAATEKLIKEETERRILFNKYQELKGNIRVMCRVRPTLGDDTNAAKIAFPDEKTSAEIALQGAEETSSLGKVTRKNFNFEFDRVFPPVAQNQDVFDEISQLVQSALDGYNVCIFCYGQTGSGKTHTMSSEDGMIPRATHMIYDTITKLKEKSWSYTMEGSFIEVYNEELHDLLTPHSRDSPAKKLEIRHDESRRQTSVTNCKRVGLDSAAKVEEMLEEAQSNRSVAATKSNERSSRSHSVFVLKLVGKNSATGERCEGTLNLVDLAGSERLKSSGAEGERMKETQSINKSLSCLGDVIEALGRGSGHVPYRNSKLTHLLQYSLGGNSKTLMFVMVSPMEEHLRETLTSLRFATKVHNTHIGTAKASKKA